MKYIVLILLLYITIFGDTNISTSSYVNINEPNYTPIIISLSITSIIITPIVLVIKKHKNTEMRLNDDKLLYTDETRITNDTSITIIRNDVYKLH